VTDLLLAVAATGLSITLMYLVCLPPMRRSRHHVPAIGPIHDGVARLPCEVAGLRARTPGPPR
jgi:hypothetical protein